MEVMFFFVDGILLALELINFVLIIVGVIVGLFIGVMLGLGSVNGVVIFLPIMFLVLLNSVIIFLVAIYYGVMYGGVILSVMLGIFGVLMAVVTTFDGRLLVLQGWASLVLVTVALVLFVGGTVVIVLFMFFVSVLVLMVLSFGLPEIFALMLLAFVIFVGLGGDDIFKTVFLICLGLVLAAVGFDMIFGELRMVLFEIDGFMRGIGFIVLVIGVYGIGEMLWIIEQI